MIAVVRTLQPQLHNQQAVTQESTDTIERKASTVYTTKHNTRFRTGTISCYVQQPVYLNAVT